MLVLFGSQTGNAQDVAERIVRQARARPYSLDACALPMDELRIEQLAEEPLVVFACSTTGSASQSTCDLAAHDTT